MNMCVYFVLESRLASSNRKTIEEIIEQYST